MRIYSKPTEKPVFRPFALTIHIETEEEFIDMYSLFSFYTNIPDVLNSNSIDFKERHSRMQKLCMHIYDALEEQDIG